MKNFYSLMNKTLLFFIASLFSLSAFAQPLSGLKNIPGDYASIALAVTSLNSNGVDAPGVTFNVTAGHTESGLIPMITATGSSAAPIVFQKAGVGNNPIITAGIGTSTTLDGIIRLSGTDYITFDGIDVQENGANTDATTRMEWGYALLKTSETDGCQYVTIKNSNITLNKAHTLSTGIYVANHTPVVTTNLVVSNVSGTSSFNKFFSNTISNVYEGIKVTGYGTTTVINFHDVFNEIGVEGGNLITNFGGGTVASNGIYTKYQNSLKVIGNTINGGNGTAAILQGIHIDVAASASAEIKGNTVTINGGGTFHAMRGIHNQSGITPDGNTITIDNNSIINCTYSTATSAIFQGILNTAGADVVNITNNTISNFSYSGTGLLHGIQNTSTNATPINITGNTISDITRASAASGIIYVVQATTGLINFSTNNIFNISQSGTSVVYGYYNFGSPTLENYIGNNIYNISSLGTGAVAGIYVNTLAASVRTVTSNKIYSLSTQGTTVYGYYGAASNQVTFSRNRISDLTSNSTTTSTVNGIHIASGNHTIQNNIIGNLFAPTTASLVAVNGIQIAGGTAHNLYYNSIHLNASTSAGGDYGSSGIFISSTSATLVVNLKNNVVVNKSTPQGLGRTVALRKANTNLDQISASTSNNLYYSGVPSAANVIYFDGTNYDELLSAYKTRVSPKEKASVTEDPSFLSLTSSSVNFLRPNATIQTKIESGAFEIAGVTNDYYTPGIRTGYPLAAQVNGAGFKPDLGAIEGDYSIFPVIDIGITNLAAPMMPKCLGTAETISFRLSNFSSSPIDFSVDPVTIESAATNTSNVTTTFAPVVLNSGTLAGGGTMNIAVSLSYDMSEEGVYSFTASSATPEDNNVANDTLVNKLVEVGAGAASATELAICATKETTLFLTGNSASSIQWESSNDGLAPWTAETGTGNNTASYTVSPMATKYYRAVVCGNMISDTVLIDVTFVPSPVASDVTRCGEGPITITATSNNPVNWYDAPVEGNLIDTGLVFNRYMTASNTFFAQAMDGGSGPETAGKLAPSLTTSTSGNAWGLVFNVVNQDMTLNSVKINSVGATAGTMSVELRSSTGVLIETVGPFAYAAGTTANPTIVTLPLNLNIPVGTGYRLQSAAMSGGSVIRETSGNTYPYTSPSGNVSITSGFITNPGSASYYWFYDWNVTSGCVSERVPVMVTVTPAPQVFASVSDSLLCQGDSTTLTATSVNSDYTYSWSLMDSTTSISGASVNVAPASDAIYIVTGVDSDDCFAVDTVKVYVNPMPQIAAIANDSSVCKTNSVQLDVTNLPLFNAPVGTGTITNGNQSYPTPYGNYYWGSKHQMLIRASELTAAGILPGPISSLSFDVTNVNSCPALENYEIKIGNSSLTVLTSTFETVNTSVFFSASYLPVVGLNEHVFSSAFVWDGVSSILVETCFNNSSYLVNGNASVNSTDVGYNTVNRNQGDNATICSNLLTGTLHTVRPNMKFMQNFQCDFAWSPSAGLSDATVQNPIATPENTTTYNVIATHPITGCTSSSSVTIVIIPGADVTFSVTDISCNNANDGAMSFVQNDTASITYVWAHDIAETATSLTGLMAGNYNLIITKTSNGCMMEFEHMMVDPDVISLSTSANDATCFGIASGEAFVNASGGTPGYSYNWNTMPAQTLSNATSLAAGTYQVTVTDENGCVEISSILVGEKDQIIIASNLNNVLCFGGNAGSITTNSTGGTGTHEYSWSHDANNTSSSAANLTANSYTLTVTDDNNCTVSEMFIVSEPTQIAGVITTQDETCAGSNNGQATVNASGGTGFYAYLWNNTSGQTGSTASNLAPGVYPVKITDSNGCESMESATVGVGNSAPTADFTFSAVENTVSFTSTGLGATSYSWNFGDGSPISSVQNPVHSYADYGNYSVTLIVTNNCGVAYTQVQLVTTGIADHNEAYTFDIFPNPTSDLVNIKFTGLQTKNLTVKVISYNGQLIVNDQLNNFTGVYNNSLNLRNYASGIYTVQVVTDNGIITKRIVLSK
ncbi:MAG: T9SS type A sorting domain-containing protein [Bacteroidetes bacterium]|nr:T9SS type A sorting domain-containing protein [Bacteroidota bacterium]HET6244648.1 PKD domain-containing protein [Bacteroidia bacterium]